MESNIAANIFTVLLERALIAWISFNIDIYLIP